MIFFQFMFVEGHCSLIALSLEAITDTFGLLLATCSTSTPCLYKISVEPRGLFHKELIVTIL